MKKLLIATLIASIFTTTSNAADLAIDVDAKLIVGLGCRHLASNSHAHLNETNPSIGIAIERVKVVYVSKNSWNKTSIYATYSPVKYKINNYLSSSIDIGFATGYKCTNSVNKNGSNFHATGNCNNSGIVPLGAVTVNYSPFADNAEISISVNPAVAMLALNYKF